jgi:hypothetical protein
MDTCCCFWYCDHRARNIFLFSDLILKYYFYFSLRARGIAWGKGCVACFFSTQGADERMGKKYPWQYRAPLSVCHSPAIERSCQ